MGAKVVGLNGDPLLSNGADPRIIEALEELTDWARKGEIIGIGIVIVRPNKEIGTRTRGGGVRHYLVAGCEYLKNDIIKESEDID
jgi:hypothetical protein